MNDATELSTTGIGRPCSYQLGFSDCSQVGFGLSGHMCLVLEDKESQVDGLRFLLGLLAFWLALAC